MAGTCELILENTRVAAADTDERPIDLVHLSRMTMGDRALEREVLQLFARQTSLLIDRMRQVSGAGVSAAAHTVKGSARGVGAWPIARAAEAVEAAASSQDEARLRAAVERLGGAADEARTVIAQLLRAN